MLPEERAASVQVRLHAFGRRFYRRVEVPRPQLVRLLATALVMLSLAYAFSFTHFPPTVTFGRLTSVHLAAAFGGALLFACLVSLLLSYARSHKLAGAAIVLVAAYLSWMVVYAFSIQQDFVKAWRNERAFWTEVLQQAPDMTEGTVILVSKAGLRSSHFIESNSWADPIILKQIFRFPTDWQYPPRLFLVPSNWTKSVVREGDELLWHVPAATWDAHWEGLPNSNVVSIDAGRWQPGPPIRIHHDPSGSVEAETVAPQRSLALGARCPISASDLGDPVARDPGARKGGACGESSVTSPM